MMKKCILVHCLLLFSTVLLAQSKLVTIERPCSENDKMSMAILYTGDGGWRPFDEKLADSLNVAGIPVLGINSLDYFRTRRTPQESASDLAQVMAHYLQHWKKTKVILIGYSFGAEVVPFIYNQLQAEMKAAVTGLFLLSPGANSDFKTHVTDRLGWLVHKWKYDVMREIMNIRNIPVLIIWGNRERKPLSEDGSHTNIFVYDIPGGHNFKDAGMVLQKMDRLIR